MPLSRFALASLLVLAPAIASGQPVETEIAGVTAELLELRQQDNVLRLAIRFLNTTQNEVSAGQPFLFNDVALVDEKAGKKYYALKDGEGRFLAGPRSDPDTGGRWWIKLPAKADAIMWMLFTPLPSGTVVDVHVPRMFPFDKVTVTEGSESRVFSATSARTTPSGLAAKLVSAVRSKQGDVRIRLRIERTGPSEQAAFVYKDFILFHPPTRALYSLNKGTDGIYLAQPQTDKGDGGRLWSNAVGPGAPALMSLSFSGPPAGVKTVDLLMPWFVPMTGIEIVDEKEP
jgi:hypothetical protein